MNAREANSLLALLRHLDGSQVTLAEELRDDVALLADAAAVALGGALPLDTETLQWTLSEVSQRFADGGTYWDEDAEEYRSIYDANDEERAVEDAPVQGRL